ncbi:hypothetical protein NFI96_023729, partial [Prochilodus magdalenae]
KRLSLSGVHNTDGMAEGIYEDVGSLEVSEKDRGERVERTVDIYVSVDAVRAQETGTKAGDSNNQTEVAAPQTGINVKEEKSNLSQTILSLRAEKETLLSSYRNMTDRLIRILGDHFPHMEEDIPCTAPPLVSQKHNVTCLHVLDSVLESQGWKRFGSSYYHFSTEQKNWNEARQACRDRGADLVIINTEEEQEFIRKEKTYAWIGLTETKTGWQWVDGSPLTTAFWNKGEPNGAKGGGNCAALTTTATTLNTWDDIPCSSKAGRICEFTLVPPEVPQ